MEGNTSDFDAEIERLTSELRHLTAHNKRTSPASAQVHCSMGELLLKHNEPEDAIDSFQKALDVIALLPEETIPCEVDCLYFYGKAMLENGNTGAAEKKCVEALVKECSNVKRYSERARDILKFLVQIYQKVERKELTAKLTSWISMIESNKSDDTEKYHVFDALYDISLYNSTIGEYDIAELIFRFMIRFTKDHFNREDPRPSKYMNSYGEMLRGQKDFVNAEVAHDSAVAIRRDLVSTGDLDPLLLAESLNNLGLVHRSMGKFNTAEELLMEGLTIRREKLCSKGAVVAGSLNNLAELFRDKGSYGQAIMFHESAIATFESALGPDHPSVVNARGNMGITLSLQARVGTQVGLDLISSAVRILEEKDFKDDHPWIVKFRNELLLFEAEKLSKNGEYDEALDLFEKVMEQNGFAKESQVTASMCRLNWQTKYHNALHLSNHAKYKEAKDLFKSCMDDALSLYDENDPLMCEITFAQAENLRLKGDANEALELYEVLLKIRSTCLGNDHPLVARLINALAVCAMDSEKHTEAKALFTKANETMKAALAANVTDEFADEKFNALLMAQILSDFAELHRRMSSYDKALDKQARGLKLRLEYLEEQSLPVADSHLLRGKILKDVGQLVEAEAENNKALMMYKRIFLNDSHPKIASSLGLKCEIDIENGKHQSARACAQQALEINEKIFSELHPSISYGLYINGCAVHAAGQYRQADKFFRKASSSSKRMFGQFSIMSSRSSCSAADSHAVLGSYKEASKLYREALTIQERALGKYHPEYFKTMLGLASYLLVTGSYLDSKGYYDTLEALFQQRYDATSAAIKDEGNGLSINTDLPARSTFFLGKAELLRTLGQHTEAAGLYEQALTLRKQMYGERHPAVCEVIHCQAENMRERGDNLTMLLSIYEKNLKDRISFFGDEHPVVVQSKQGLRDFCIDFRRGDSRLLLVSRTELIDCCYISGRCEGVKSLAYASICNSIGLLLTIEAQFDEAKKYLEDAHTTRIECLGQDHVLVAESLNNLCTLCRAMDDIPAAKTFGLRARDVFTAALGPTHPRTINAEGNLGLIMIMENHTMTAGLQHINIAIDELKKLEFNAYHPWIVKFERGRQYVNSVMRGDEELGSDYDGQEDIYADSLDSLEQEVVDLEISIQEKDAEIEALQKKCSEQEETIQFLQETVKKSSSDTEISASSDIIDGVDSVKDLMSQIAELKAAMTQLQGQYDIAIDENKAYKNLETEREAALSTMTNELHTAQQAKIYLESELQRVNGILNTGNSTQKDFNDEGGVVEGESPQSELPAEDVRIVLEKSQQENARLKEELARSAENSKLSGNISELETQLSRSAKNLQEAEQKIQKTDDEYARLTEELEQARNELNILKASSSVSTPGTVVATPSGDDHDDVERYELMAENARLRRKLASVVSVDTNTYEARIHELEKAVENGESALADSQQALCNSGLREAELTTALENAEQQLRDIKEEKMKLEATLKATEKATSEAQSGSNVSPNSIDRNIDEESDPYILMEEIARLKRKLSSSSKGLLEENLKEEENGAQKTSDALQEAERRLRMSQQENNELKNDLAKLRGHTTKSQLVSIANDPLSERDSMHDLLEISASAMKRVGSYEAIMEDLESKVRQGAIELQQAEDKLTEVREEHKKSQSENDTLIETLRQKVDTSESIATDFRSKVSCLEEQIHNQDLELQALKNALKDATKEGGAKNMDGVHSSDIADQKSAPGEGVLSLQQKLVAMETQLKDSVAALQSAKENLSSSNEEKEKLAGELARLRADADAAVDTEKSALLEKISQLNEQLEASQSLDSNALNGMFDVSATAMKQIGSYEEKYREAESRAAEQAKALSVATSDLETMRDEKSRLEAEVDRLRSTTAGISPASAHADDDLRMSLREEIVRLHGVLVSESTDHKTSNKLDEVSSDNIDTQLRAEVTLAVSVIQALRDDVSVMESKLQALESRLSLDTEGSEDELMKLKESITLLSSQKEGLENDLSSSRDNVVALEGRLADEETSKKSLKEYQAMLEEKIVVLKENLSSAEEKSERVSAALSSVEIELKASHEKNSKLESDLADKLELSASVSNLQEQFSAVSLDLSKERSLLQDAEAKLGIAESENKGMSEELVGCKSRIHELEAAIESLEQKCREHRSELQNCEDKISHLEEELYTESEKNQTLSEANAGLNYDLEELRDTLKQNSGDKEGIESRLMDLQRRYDDLKADASRKSGDLTTLQENLGTANSLVERLKAEVGDLTFKAERMQSEIADLTTESDKKSSEISFLSHSIEGYEVDAASREAQLQRALDKMKSFDDEKYALQSEIDELKAREEDLKRQLSRAKEQRRLMDPWGFSKEAFMGYKRFMTPSSNSSRPISESNTHIQSPTSDISDAAFGGYRGVKSIKSASVAKPDNEGTENGDIDGGQLSKNIDELLFGSCPSKNFVAAKSAVGDVDFKPAYYKSTSRPELPDINMRSVHGDYATNNGTSQRRNLRSESLESNTSCNWMEEGVTNSPFNKSSKQSRDPDKLFLLCFNDDQDTPNDDTAPIKRSKSTENVQSHPSHNQTTDEIMRSTAPESSTRAMMKAASGPSNNIEHTSEHNTNTHRTRQSKTTKRTRKVKIPPPEKLSVRSTVYGCCDTEVDRVVTQRSPKDGKKSVEALDSIKNKPKRPLSDMDWDRRYQKSPFDTVSAPHRWSQDEEYEYEALDTKSLATVESIRSRQKELGLY